MEERRASDLEKAMGADGQLDDVAVVVVAQDEEKAVSAIEDVLEGDENPLNFSQLQKWMITAIVVAMTAMIAYTSSMYTPAISVIGEELHCSYLVSTLGVSTYLLGFGFGPLVFSPMSEIFGRNAIYRPTVAIFVLSQLVCALTPNIGLLLAFRFIGAFFGAPCVTSGGGTLTDIWASSQRSVPFALFSAACFIPPVLAPMIAGYIIESTTWRWNFWMMLIISGIIFVSLFFVPETYQPTLLERKLKKKEGVDVVTSKKKGLARKLKIGLLRPWKMLFRELILCTVSLYIAFVYGILFLDFTAYPIVFKTDRGWSIGASGLSFLGIAFGMAVSTAVSPYYNTIYKLYVKKLGGSVPEARLPPLTISAWFIPLGLFWFGWTASPSHHWIIPILAGVPFGYGFVTLFLILTAYTTDCYGKYSASALAVHAIVRSIFGAVFPLFSHQMYVRLGTPWATSLLGFIAVALAPMPWLFYKFGPQLRRRSRYHRAVIRGEDM